MRDDGIRSTAEEIGRNTIPSIRRTISYGKGLIVTTLGYRLLRGMQSASGPARMWTKLIALYAESPAASRIVVSGSLMNIRYSSGKEMEDYLDELGTSFNKMVFWGFAVAEEMNVAILLVSLMNK